MGGGRCFCVRVESRKGQWPNELCKAEPHAEAFRVQEQPRHSERLERERETSYMHQLFGERCRLTQREREREGEGDGPVGFIMGGETSGLSCHPAWQREREEREIERERCRQKWSFGNIKFREREERERGRLFSSAGKKTCLKQGRESSGLVENWRIR